MTMNNKNNKETTFAQLMYVAKIFTRWFGNILVPIFYLFVWIGAIKLSETLLGLVLFDNDLFLILSFLILFLGIISRTTSWQIGHTHFGIKADTLGRFLNFHRESDGSYWFDAFIDQPEKINELKDLIENLSKQKNEI